MITENRALQYNLLKQFDQLVRQISGHKRLDRDCDVIWVLCLAEGSLDNLVNEWTTELVLLLQDMRPQFRVTALHKVTGF